MERADWNEDGLSKNRFSYPLLSEFSVSFFFSLSLSSDPKKNEDETYN
jgi:hypothetical protein